MDYEKLYKEAKQRAIDASIDGFLDAVAVEEIFSELKESGDERIREKIIATINLYYGEPLEEEAKEMIAWLEKQESVEEIVERCKASWYNEGKIQGQIEGLSDDEKYQQGWHDALEKQGEPFDDNIITRDDEILQAISVGLTDAVEDFGWSDFGGLPIEEIQDWLEKQGEPNPYSGVSFEYNGHIWGMCARDNGVDILLDKQLFKHLEKQETSYTKKDVDDAYVEGMAFAKDELEKQNKQILANSAKTCKDEQKLSNLESIGKEWSEEDEIIRKTLTNIVNMFYEGCFGKAERNLLLNWLKYLKERVQPKKDWSNEDEKEWKSIVSVLTRMHFLDELDWLRSKLKR